MIVLKNIVTTLDPLSLSKAAAELRHFAERIQPAMTHLIDRLTEKGVEIARAELIFFDPPAYDLGFLSESIGAAMISETEGVVTTGIMYAMYVEFGTGEYAANGDGRQGGWTYFNERTGRFTFTRGMSARPFMTNTLRDLEEEAEANGGRIVAEYLAE